MQKYFAGWLGKGKKDERSCEYAYLPYASEQNAKYFKIFFSQKSTS